VQRSVDGLRGVTRRRVLASDGWFAGGKLFALVSRQARIVVKVAVPATQDELLALDGAQMWQIGKKAPMRGWIQLPEAFHDDDEALQRWIARAFTEVQQAAPAAGRSGRRSRSALGTARRRKKQ